MPDQDTEIFVELKKKYKGVVFKRRAVMTMEEARAYLHHGEKPEANGQILSENRLVFKYVSSETEHVPGL